MAAEHWEQGKERLERAIGRPRFGLFSDLDGTLSPIAPTPEAAQITPRNRELLAELARQLPLVALISGRRVASLQERVGIPGIIYIGNHGLERWVDGKTEVLPEAAAYATALRAARGELEGLVTAGALVEDKGATLSVHYRGTKYPSDFALGHAVQIGNIAKKHGLELFTGKMVFEMRPPIHVDKGSAFRKLVEENKLQAALFLGDDISDLHALSVAKQMREEKLCDSWGIGVQSNEAPDELAEAADYLATGVADVEALLGWLSMARKASST
jgi:trehalose 6-phosphate phosphatase